MLDAICAEPQRLDEFAAMLAQVQAALHRLPCDGLPPQREHMMRRVLLGPLPARVKPGVVKLLRGLPDQRMVCHGDLHPGNVILTPDGVRVIDWFDATAGCPTADLARTCLLLRYARLAAGAGRTAFDPLRARFVDTFLQCYRDLLPEPVQGLAGWVPPVAAARIAEPISGQERNALLRMIESLLAAAGATHHRQTTRAAASDDRAGQATPPNPDLYTRARRSNRFRAPARVEPVTSSRHHRWRIMAWRTCASASTWAGPRPR